MKRHISILQLIARTSFWKVLLVLCAMTVSQVLLFFVMGAGEEPYLLDAMQRVPSFAVVLIGLILLSCALYIPMSDRGGRMNNLILRLGLTEKQIFWIHVMYNVLIYSLFVMAQALTMLLLCLIHDWVTPGDMDPMAVFVTSYQHPLFHRFFPLHNVVGWINHLILIVGMSICTAAYPIRQRHRFGSLCTNIMTAYAAVYYCGLVEGDYLHFSEMALPFIVTLILVAICLYGVLTLEVDDDGKT